LGDRRHPVRISCDGLPGDARFHSRNNGLVSTERP
jgi:hypothetical protein